MGTLLRRRLTALALLPLLLGAAGVASLTGAPASAQEASPSPAPSPSSAPAVQVGNADDGRTVHLVTGQELHVRLVAPQGEQWQGPATADELYLVQYSERAAETTARLHALRTGTTTLRARTDRSCFHSNDPCPQAFSEWSLEVVVQDGPAPDTNYPCVPRATVTPAPGSTDLTQSSSGRVTVEVGQPIHVALSDCSERYTVPTATAGPLWRDRAALGFGHADATFRGLRPGTATLTAHTDPACFHTATPCTRPSRAWAVEIEVVPAGTCEQATVQLERDTVVATGDATATVRAPAGAKVDLYAYTRPSTTFRLVRSATAGEDGLARFTVRPPANTRLYAVLPGCAAGPSVVLNVRTALTLTAERTGPRTYLFAGDSLPARPGGLVVSLYRLTDDGRQVLTAQTRADAAGGDWSLTRRFTGSGRFGFVVRTGQDLQNAPGSSNVRSLLVF